MCSTSWLISVGTVAWCGWLTGSRGCRRARLPAGCRRCRGSIRMWSRGGIRRCRPIRCRVACRPDARWVAEVADGAGGAGAADVADDLAPGDVDRLVAALRTHRDRAMVLAMVLAGLRRCEVLGLRFTDVQAGPALGHHRGQGRTSPGSAGREWVLRRSVTTCMTSGRRHRVHGSGVCGAQGAAARAAAVGGGPG